MRKKKLAIYFSDPEPMGDPFNSTYPYWEIYQEIIRDIEKHGIEVYIVRGAAAYLGKGVFLNGWQINNGALVFIDKSITVDLIFHKGNYSTIPGSYDCPMINHPDMERFCRDKVKIAEVFSDISPKTKAVSSYHECMLVVAEWNLNPQDKIVIKKNFLSSGHGIHIMPIKDVSESLFDNWQDVLVQEFVDSSVGISGIVQGLHDIRVITINGEPVYTFIRVPAPGSFLANIAQGGKELAVALDKLPSSLLEMVARVNKYFAQFRPSILGADFFNSKDGFKLIELNAPPGMRNSKFSPQDKELQGKIVQMLVDALKR